MARAIETLVTQSVLDRLSNSEDWPTTRAHSVRLLREVLRRDMEWLLNTRRPPIPGLDGPESKRSVLNYGLVDTSSLSLASSLDRRRLQQAVQTCIADFEPRLQRVVVVLAEENLKARQLRFHIEGQIRLDPAPEEISFDTVLELASGEYRVS